MHILNIHFVKGEWHNVENIKLSGILFKNFYFFLLPVQLEQKQPY